MGQIKILFPLHSKVDFGTGSVDSNESFGWWQVLFLSPVPCQISKLKELNGGIGLANTGYKNVGTIAIGLGDLDC
ncbi:hypothetical protein E2542_SST03673 [Spatholobus suberectus]|nr:hypothetical protein E2542_SST03673 [Spatholobus suberectus]